MQQKISPNPKIIYLKSGIWQIFSFFKAQSHNEFMENLLTPIICQKKFLVLISPLLFFILTITLCVTNYDNFFSLYKLLKWPKKTWTYPSKIKLIFLIHDYSNSTLFYIWNTQLSCFLKSSDSYKLGLNF